MITYKEGKAEIANAIQELVTKVRPDLVDAKIRVIEASKLNGQQAIRVTQATPGDRVDGYDLVVIYDGAVFTAASQEKVKALLDHGLGYWQGVEKRGRKGKPGRRAYQRRKPIEVHLSVLKRNGATLDEWQQLASECRQLELPMSTVVDIKKSVKKKTGATAEDQSATA